MPKSELVSRRLQGLMMEMFILKRKPVNATAEPVASDNRSRRELTLPAKSSQARLFISHISPVTGTT